MEKNRKQKKVLNQNQSHLYEINITPESSPFEIYYLPEYPADRIFRAFKNKTEDDHQRDRNHKKF